MLSYKFNKVVIIGGVGSGKSTFITNHIDKIVTDQTYDALFLYDPKQVELRQYKNFPIVKDYCDFRDLDFAERSIELLEQNKTKKCLVVIDESCIDSRFEEGFKKLTRYIIKHNIDYIVSSQLRSCIPNNLYRHAKTLIKLQ